MRRAFVVCAVLIAACGSGEKPADTVAAAPATPPPPAPISLADMAGTWDTKTMPVDRDTVLSTAEVTATGTMEGWKLKIGGKTYNTKVVAVAGDSVITETGPFPSVLRKGQTVSIHTISRLRDGKMVGVNHAKYSNGDTATLRLEGTKKAMP